MSILTGNVSAKEGSLVVDTLASSHAIDLTEPLHVSKSNTIPHLGAVFGTRGSVAFPTMLLATTNNRRIADFDDLLAQLAKVVSDAYGTAAPMISEFGQHHAIEVVIMGWSRSRSRTVAVYAKNFECADGRFDPRKEHVGYSPEFAIQEIPDGVFVLPGVERAEQDRIMAARRMEPRDRLIAFAKAQRDSVERRVGPGYIGGRLVLSTVSKFAIEVRTIFEWPDTHTARHDRDSETEEAA